MSHGKQGKIGEIRETKGKLGKHKLNFIGKVRNFRKLKEI